MGLAESYYEFGLRPAEKAQWTGLIDFVRNRMADLGRDGNAAEIRSLWKKLEPVVWRYAAPKYPVYLAVSRCLARAGDVEAALQLYQRAEQIALQERNPYAQTDVACAGAEVFSLAGDWDGAARQAGTCFDLFSLRGKDPGPEMYRLMGSLEARKGELDHAVDYFRKSISIAERTRSSYAVKERAAFFRSAIRGSYWGLIECLARQAMQSPGREAFRTALEASELLRARQFGEMILDKEKDRHADSNPANPAEILEADEILLSYLQTDDNIVLLAFTRQWQTAHVLPYDKDQLRRLLLSISEDLASPYSSQSALDERLARLSRQLIGPVRATVGAQKRVIVLTDSLLDLLPFDLLTLSDETYRPLILDKIVSRAPSLKYLMQTRRKAAEKHRGGFFAVADPVYGEVPTVYHLSAEELRGLTPGTDYTVFFTPLPETSLEVTRIAEMFAGEPVTLLTRDRASESNLKAADLRSYGTLHFATHGILRDDLPIIDDPALALSREPGEDGFFTAAEASRLNLDAALTVLSACNTGRGEYVVGEGVMGLSRAFLLAGSRNVVMSLWSIPSEATTELMLRFYQHYRTGMDPPEALRMAKMEMMKTVPPELREPRAGGSKQQPEEIPDEYVTHPFFWAAFVSIGA
jgi:CHAT domain-containing protein